MRIAMRLFLVLGAVALGFQLRVATTTAHAVLDVPAQYPTIQAAIDAASPGATISVAPGTYVEQLTIQKDLTIEGAGAGSTIIQAPATMVPFEYTLYGTPRIAIVQISGDVKVRITGVTVSGPLPALCSGGRTVQIGFGVNAINGATLTMTDSRVTGIRSIPVGRCFSGFGIRIGTESFGLAAGGSEAAYGTISDVVVDDYQRAGITVVGNGSFAKVVENRVTGLGPTTGTSQVGIGIAFGGAASVSGNHVSGNLCDRFICGPDYLNQVQSVGIFAAWSGPGTSITENESSDNDTGIDVEGASDPRISENVLANNRFFGITLLDGSYTTSENEISGGMVGIAVAALTQDCTALLRGDEITGTTVAPVQELSNYGFVATAIRQSEDP